MTETLREFPGVKFFIIDCMEFTFMVVPTSRHVHDLGQFIYLSEPVIMNGLHGSDLYPRVDSHGQFICLSIPAFMSILTLCSLHVIVDFDIEIKGDETDVCLASVCISRAKWVSKSMILIKHISSCSLLSLPTRNWALMQDAPTIDK